MEQSFFMNETDDSCFIVVLDSSLINRLTAPRTRGLKRWYLQINHKMLSPLMQTINYVGIQSYRSLVWNPPTYRAYDYLNSGGASQSHFQNCIAEFSSIRWHHLGLNYNCIVGTLFDQKWRDQRMAFGSN